MSSPLGLLFLARSERGLRYLEFMDRKSLKRMIESHREHAPGATWDPSLLDLKPVVEQLETYFSGMLTRFDLPLDPQGSEFQHEVWKRLLEIPFGRTRAYGEIARDLGQPGAARAVGLANNRNPVAIVIPCHRVVGADGALTGYGGGMPRKRWLLDHEAHIQRLDLGPPVPSRTGETPRGAVAKAAVKTPAATKAPAAATRIAGGPAKRETPAPAAIPKSTGKAAAASRAGPRRTRR
jgi:O-6-methylguanine DNA methyltransferase